METNKTKSVGEEFIEWASKEKSLKHHYRPEDREEMADKINDIIHNRVIELLKEQNTKR